MLNLTRRTAPRHVRCGRPVERTTVPVLGLEVAPLSMEQMLDAIDARIAARQPGFIITANLNYAMITAENPRLAEVNRDAALIVADGAPLLWAARVAGQPLPERIAGSDLVPRLCQRAALRGHRVYLFGGAEGVAQLAAEKLTARFPGLTFVGIDAPPFRTLSTEENRAIVDRIRETAPDILLVASSQPKGEIWLHENYRQLGVPAAIQIGASIDFAAGRVTRAPGWVGRTGLEWAFRLAIEPRRLARRYFRNGCFLLGAATRGLASRLGRPRTHGTSHPTEPGRPAP